MCECSEPIVVQVWSDGGNAHVNVQTPANVQPSALREARDQAIGAFGDALRLMTEETLLVHAALPDQAAHPAGARDG